jgi:hypothetical protein
VRRALLIVVGLLFAVPQHARAVESLPNLVPRAPFNLVVAQADGSASQKAIRLSTTTENIGAGHLELLGIPPLGLDETAAMQCVEWDNRVCQRRDQVGTFEFHAEHQHWHFNDYARYDLRALLPNGLPDMTEAGLLRSGGKISFCLLDTERSEKRDPEPDDPFGDAGFYHGCTGLIQGISRGWADTYGSYLVGQQIVLDGLANGRYALMITVNPLQILRESSYTDNVSHAVIDLNGDDVRVVG